MLPFWKQQFIRNDTGEWILTEEFVDPDDVPESPSPSSDIPPSGDPHPSSVPEETETPHQYVTSIVAFPPQESSICGTYTSDPIPSRPSHRLPSPSFWYHGGGNPTYSNPN
ncbi:hypothetical protein M422DRAFT_774271, partial [Sphaerobolus stellatus SS14]